MSLVRDVTSLILMGYSYEADVLIMKRFALVAALILSSLVSHAQDEPSFRYIPVERYSSELSVALSDIDDFVARARRENVEELYRQVIDNGHGHQRTTHFIFESSGVFVVFDANNFMTVRDLKSGVTAGFSDGLEFYDAKERDFLTKAEYDYAVGEGFHDALAYREALRWGFVNPPEAITYLPLPDEIPERQFMMLVRTHAANVVRLGLSIRTDHPLAQALADCGLLSGPLGRQSTRTLLRTDLKPYEMGQAVDIVARHWQDEFGKSTRNRRVADLEYLYDDGIFRLNSETDRYEPTRFSFGGMAVVGQTSGKPEPYFPSDGTVYYIGTLNGYQTFERFRAFSTAMMLRFQSLGEYEQATAAGFTRSQAYYDAVSKGFENAEDYHVAMRMGFSSYVEYVPSKELKGAFDQYVEHFGVENYREAAIVCVLEELATGRTVSFQRILDDANTLIRENRKFSNLDRSFTNLSMSEFQGFLQEYEPDLLPIGFFSKEDSVFTRL